MKFSTAAAAIATLATAASAVNITVKVGENETGEKGLFISPQVINAQVGDLINFEFRGGNHTITQSSFAVPCTQQFNTVTQQNGFTSPFIPFDAASGQIGVYTLEVTQVAAPIWFFCGRAPHCKGGMYGAINPAPTGERTFEAFAANVQTAAEPGLGVTAPFTPPNASGAPPAATGGGAAGGVGTGVVGSTNTGAQPPAATGAASSLVAGSSLLLGLLSVAAGLIL
jgi:plastocyanin